MFTKWEELKITYSMKELNEIETWLNAAGILYKVKTDTRLGGNRGRVGTNQMNMDTYYEYRIFVKKEDLEQAKSL